MSALSQWYEAKILNFLRGTAFATTPSALEIRLHTADPLDDYSGAAEVVGNGYVKQAITLGAPSSVVGTGTTVVNSGNIIFGPAVTAAWGSISHWSIHGSAGDTNFYFKGAFLAVKTVNVGDGYSIPDGTLEILVR